MLLSVTLANSTRAADSPWIENRFLFIVDISASMRPLASEESRAVLALLRSRMEGQMTNDDTFGVWTYNDQLHAELPMQTWTADQSDQILALVGRYLDSRKYEKRARLDKVWPFVTPILKASRTLTVVLISDSTGDVKGTKFDADINDLHKQFAADFRKQQMPFVTILAGRNGEVFDYTINGSVGPFRVPPTYEPRPQKPVPAPVVVVAPPKPPAPRQIEIRMAGTTNLSMVDGKPVAPPTTPTVVASTEPSKPVAPATPVPAAETQTKPAPQAQAPTPAAVEPVRVPTPTPAPAVIPEPPKPVVVQPVQPPPAQEPVRAVAPPVVETQSPPEPPKPAPKPAVAETTPAPAPAPVVTPVPTPAPPVVTKPQPTPAVPVAIESPKPAVLPAPVPSAQEQVKTPGPSVDGETAPKPQAPKSAPASTPAQLASSVTPPNDSFNLLMAAGALLVVAAGAGFFLLRRKRANAHPSLISQSMDRMK